MNHHPAGCIYFGRILTTNNETKTNEDGLNNLSSICLLIRQLARYGLTPKPNELIHFSECWLQIKIYSGEEKVLATMRWACHGNGMSISQQRDEHLATMRWASRSNGMSISQRWVEHLAATRWACRGNAMSNYSGKDKKDFEIRPAGFTMTYKFCQFLSCISQNCITPESKFNYFCLQ
jgi:hypothetical protein